MRLSSTRSKQQRRVVVRRKAHAMDQDLAFVKWAEIVRRGIAQADDAERLVARRIDHGDRVGELISCVDAVMRADRYVGLVEGCLNQKLAGIQGAQSSRLIIAEMNDAEEYVCRRIDGRDCIRGLA